jgi:hypothetical protein
MGMTLVDGDAARQEQLLARLSEERTAEALNRLLDRLEIIVFATEALDGFLHRADIISDSVSESVGDLRKMVGESGTAALMSRLPQLAQTGAQVADIAQSAPVQRLIASGLLEKLGDPATIASIKGLIDKLELAVFSLEAMDGFLKRGDEIAENLAEGVADARGLAPDIDPRKLRQVLVDLPTLVEAGSVLVKSGMLDPDVVMLLGEAGHVFARAYDDARGHKPQNIGLLGLAKALRDPDVSRSLEFGLRIAKAFGKSLQTR